MVSTVHDPLAEVEVMSGAPAEQTTFNPPPTMGEPTAAVPLSVVEAGDAKLTAPLLLSPPPHPVPMPAASTDSISTEKRCIDRLNGIYRTFTDEGIWTSRN